MNRLSHVLLGTQVKSALLVALPKQERVQQASLARHEAGGRFEVFPYACKVKKKSR
jgi:hypothetical protein